MNTLNDTGEIKRMQWVKGDKLGSVETVSQVDSEWIYFDSGARIASSLLNEYMIPIFDEPLNFNNTEQPISKPKRQTVESKQKNNSDNSNPIRILLNNQKSIDEVDLKVSFTVKLPKKEILKVLDSAFDNSEILPELELYVIDQVNEEFIKNNLIESIKSLIKSKYKGFFYRD
jgi:hypothetical protein